MIAVDSVMIDGYEFPLFPRPSREEPASHRCVCLLTMQREDEGVIRTITDKCIAVVDNSDQPFCDDCERSGHPLLDHQIGLAKKE